MAEYQGWRNYETWNVALWIDNDRRVYETVREWAKEAWEEAENPANHPYITDRDRRAVYTLADQIQELVEDGNPLASDASMYSDMLSAAISEVDWAEIATGRIEEVDKEEVKA